MSLEQIAIECGTDKGEWQQFMPYYERYIPGPDHPVTMLELGVYKGESMNMWARYYRHQRAEIIGLDRDLSLCPPFIDLRVSLVKADQADAFVADQLLANDHFDFIVDDASHISSKTIASFHVWWPRVAAGGVYVVEDTHCSYDTDWYGDESRAPLELPSNRRPRYPRLQKATTMEFLKRLADDVNWDHHNARRFQCMYPDIEYVHFYPGICFIGKKDS